LRGLDAPLLDDHSFRQTQTAITVWTMVEEGISLFNYETPVFGPPWKLPYEFPLFQATAALLVKLGIPNIDVACRLANLLYFYLSAFLLYLLSARFLPSAAALCVLLCYLWAPFNVFWSRTALIDFASVAFALSYAYSFERWLAQHRPPNRALGNGRSESAPQWARRTRTPAKCYFVTILLGALTYLVKPTTVPIVMPLIIALVAVHFSEMRYDGAPHKTITVLRDRAPLIVLVGLAVLLPALAGAAWTRYSDAVLDQQEFTAMKGLLGRHFLWLSGPLSERLNLSAWQLLLQRIREGFFPGWLTTLPCVGLLSLFRESKRIVLVAGTMIAAVLLTPLIFFNIYRIHSYYVIAVAPCTCVLSGLGLYALLFVAPRRSLLLYAVPAVIFAFSYRELVQSIAWHTPSDNNVIVQLGRLIQKVTPEHERVIVADFDWHPGILYYARRRGFMYRSQFDPDMVGRFAKRHGFSTIVCRQAHPRLFAHWRSVQEIGRAGAFHVLRVSEPAP
jgi:4-amino-4-deoxy-L-arabinose transferase-like glycosyltransferase